MEQEFSDSLSGKSDQTFVCPTFKERLFDRVFESLKYYMEPVALGAFCGLAWGLGINMLTTWPNLKPEPMVLLGLGLAGATTGIWLADEARKARYLS